MIIAPGETDHPIKDTIILGNLYIACHPGIKKFD